MMESKEEYIVAKEIAIKYMGLAKKTCNEVRRKLQSKQIENDIIEKVLLDLQEAKYLDDNEYVNLYIKQEVKKAVKSKKEIEIFLVGKGLDQRSVLEKLENISLDYEKNVISHLNKTKLINMEDLKKKQYLYRRGFELEGR